jgi:hypothetical protein
MATAKLYVGIVEWPEYPEDTEVNEIGWFIAAESIEEAVANLAQTLTVGGERTIIRSIVRYEDACCPFNDENRAVGNTLVEWSMFAAEVIARQDQPEYYTPEGGIEVPPTGLYRNPKYLGEK